AALGIPVKASLMKGRGNYLCRRKVSEAVLATQRLIAPDDIDKEGLVRIARWVDENEEGSRTELGFTPPGDLWDSLKTDRDSCPRTRCAFHQRCFFYRARRAAS